MQLGALTPGSRVQLGALTPGSRVQLGAPTPMDRFADRRFRVQIQLMDNALLLPYRDVAYHQRVSAIIREFSTNKRAPGEVFLSGANLNGARRVLDLGCGFGFMTQYLAAVAAQDALITGMDACETNRIPFTRAVEKTGRRSRFICQAIGRALPFDNESFDAVMSSYSLYFFIEAVPDISRILAPEGCFIAVSHRIGFVDGLLRVAGMSHKREETAKIFGAFCCENGEALLAPYFSRVERISYRNSLLFRREDVEPLTTYIKHKLPFFIPGSCCDETVHQAVALAISTYLEQHEKVVLEKNDCCFLCRLPRGGN